MTEEVKRQLADWAHDFVEKRRTLDTMKNLDKKAIMRRLDKLISDDFECDHIHVTFPNDDKVRIELSNDPEISEDMKQRIIDAAHRAIERSHEDPDVVDRTEVETQVLLGLLKMLDELKG